jgi:formate hydrogenlyase subunit 4
MERLNLPSMLSPLFGLALAPLLFGIIGKTKALFAGRKGPPVLQTYYDIRKLLGKGAVYSTTASWIFKAGPVVSLAALLAASCMVPVGDMGAPVSFTGDIFLFIYLLALVRFVMVAAALDTGSPFEGMGASREVFFSALAEPVFLVCLVSLAQSASDFRFADVLGQARQFAVVPAILSGVSLFVVVLAENARIPVDDPATHLELTMIHEVMVLDHSGPDFAYITYGASIKLWLGIAIVARTFLPVHANSAVVDCGLTLAIMAALTVCVGVVESVMARLRLLKVPQLLMGAAALAVLALLSGKGGLLQ